ncbi:MAG: hypothetical protein ACTHKV_02285 [Flavipsychrobacter sp.]
MKDSLKTFSIAAITSIVVMTSFSFKPADPGNSAPQHIVYEYKQFSTIESVIPGGLGRSRILTTDDNGQMIEKELKNFYSMVGINFGNIANNDRAIVDRINDYSNQGWELMQVSTGSHEQASNGSSSGGLFITRYLFRRAK